MWYLVISKSSMSLQKHLPLFRSNILITVFQLFSLSTNTSFFLSLKIVKKMSFLAHCSWQIIYIIFKLQIWNLKNDRWYIAESTKAFPLFSKKGLTSTMHHRMQWKSSESSMCELKKSSREKRVAVLMHSPFRRINVTISGFFTNYSVYIITW